MNRFDYRFHEDLNLIAVRPAGVVNVSDIVSYAEEILSLGILSEGTIEYYDLCDMTNLEGDFSTAFGLASQFREWISRGWLGSVFFTPREYQFGMIRMIGTIAESVQEARPVVMVPCREPTALGDVCAVIAERRQIS